MALDKPTKYTVSLLCRAMVSRHSLPNLTCADNTMASFPGNDEIWLYRNWCIIDAWLLLNTIKCRRLVMTLSESENTDNLQYSLAELTL